ncbi:hypothetical protein BJX66DRAFT_335957 [Aspergillus keveii]|uniref:Uncharacterized protein n=1 Tax=Aspergillus keveii TaxID=714993 RepID=A0ABR4GBS8_9EURO
MAFPPPPTLLLPGIQDKMGKPRLPERLKPHRSLSTVLEENESEEEDAVQTHAGGNGHGHKGNETGKSKKREDANTNATINAEYEDDGEALPIEIYVHGLKAKVYANCADVDIVPARYLEKADRSPLLKRTPWIFRTARNGRTVNLSKWSKVDIRYRGVFKTLRKVPQFTKGLFENDTAGELSSLSSSSSSSKKNKFDFEEAAKAQGQVVYALLEEILVALKIRREAGGLKEYFYLRPRLLNCQPEYWTGYRIKHRDSPFTAGSLALDYEPERGIARAVVPVSTTQSRRQPLTKALEGSFKLLLAQLLVHIHRLSPPGDKLPDQETFLITLHGSRLHILRGVFPGQKTSRLWCGRHNPPPTTPTPMTTSTSTSTNTLTTHHHNGTDPEHGLTHSLITNMTSRFYTKLNLQRFMEQIEWNQLSNPENEASPRGFQILASREYDLWKKDEFFAAVRLLAALVMYLLSGTARCGSLQDVFARWPYDEGDEEEEDDSGDGCRRGGWGARMEEEVQRFVEEQERLLREEERRKAEEDRKRVREREAMREAGRDRIAGIGAGGGLRQPWWDWVWEDKTNEGCVKDDSDAIFRGP